LAIITKNGFKYYFYNQDNIHWIPNDIMIFVNSEWKDIRTLSLLDNYFDLIGDGWEEYFHSLMS